VNENFQTSSSNHPTPVNVEAVEHVARLARRLAAHHARIQLHILSPVHQPLPPLIGSEPLLPVLRKEKEKDEKKKEEDEKF